MSELENDETDSCVRCGTGLTTHGVEEFRTGGTRGLPKYLLGAWGELSEDLLPLLVLSCRRCKRVELRLP